MISRRSEAAAVGAAGAVLAFAVGRPLGVGGPAAVVGAASGAVNGWRRTYCWRRWQGWVAFVADHTWALASSLGGLVSHAWSLAGGSPGYDVELSERRGRHVYAGGLLVRRGYAMTLGNVVTGAGDPRTGEVTPQRRRLVENHEDVHIWQARLLGPAYPVAYVGWAVLAAPVGVWRWWRGDRQRSLGAHVDAVAYRANPFERWAYGHQARREVDATATGGTPAALR